MKVFIADLPVGVFALNEAGEVIEYELHPKNVDDVVEELLKIEKGELSSAHKRLIERLKEKNVDEIVVEHDSEARNLSKEGFAVNVQAGAAPFVIARENLEKFVVENELFSSREEFDGWLFEVTLEYTRRKLRSAAQKRDLLAAQAIRAIDDIDKTVNLFVARLREWYGLHFPELNDLVRDHETFAKIVYELGHRNNITVENLVKLGFSENKARELEKAAKSSIGADLSDFDIEALRTLAGIVVTLYKMRHDLVGYIENVMKEVAPNITALVGPLLGARLISLAGGLDRLAKLPASTIQVLGAEKALFRALRTGGKPPKHGVIFQYPDIHRSPRWQRGKIARALAAKLAIAAKVDAFTGRFIGDKLKEELRKRIEEIKKIYAKPPKRKEEARPPAKHRGRPPRRGRRRGRGRR